MVNMKKKDSMNEYFIVFMCFFIMAFCEVGKSSDLPKSFLDVEAVLAVWESTYGDIKNMSVSYTEEVINVEPPAKNPQKFDTLVRVQHVERVEQEKYYHIRYSKSIDGFTDPKNIMEHAFDGKITKEYWPDRNFGTIELGLIGRDVEKKNRLKHYLLLDIQKTTNEFMDIFPDGIPMFSLLLRTGMSSSNIKVNHNLESIAGESCHVIECVKENSGFRVWVAHDKGMLPLKYQYFINGSIMEEIEIAKIAMTETESGNIWYPLEAHRTSSWKDMGTVNYKIITRSFIPNINIDKNTFTFDFPNGTEVFDKILGLSYIVGVGNYSDNPPEVMSLNIAEQKTNSVKRERIEESETFKVKENMSERRKKRRKKGTGYF